MESMESMESIWNTPCGFHAHSIIKVSILSFFIHHSIWKPPGSVMYTWFCWLELQSSCRMSFWSTPLCTQSEVGRGWRQKKHTFNLYVLIDITIGSIMTLFGWTWPVLYSAPPISVGLQSFQQNLVESGAVQQNGTESSGFHQILEWNRNRTGIS